MEGSRKEGKVEGWGGRGDEWSWEWRKLREVDGLEETKKERIKGGMVRGFLYSAINGEKDAAESNAFFEFVLCV